MFKSVSKIEIQVPAEIKSIKEIRDFISRIGKKYRLSDKAVNAFKLAADEASTNIIRHAYREKEGMITVRAIVRKQDITLSLIDQGRYFDPQGVKDPDLKRYVAIGKRGGLGIMMIRKLVDDIDYRRTEEGNELRLTKNREDKKRRLSFMSSKTGSLRIKYYSIAAAIVSSAVLIVYSYNYVTVDDRIIQSALEEMRKSASTLAVNSIDDLMNKEAGGGLDLSKKVKRFAVQNQRLLDYAVVTDVDNTIRGTSDAAQFTPGIRKFQVQSPKKTFDRGISLAEITIKSEDNEFVKEYFVSSWPVISTRNNDEIGKAQILVPAKPVFEDIRVERTQVLKIAAVVLLAVNVGVGLLIILVFIPLQKLSNWVKTIGEGDIKDQIDIDTSDEIGEIAQAFSEITDKFRETQKSLVDQERIQQEMHLAKEIQRTLLPAKFPKIDGYEIASYYESAKEVGGDYYDFVEIDRNRMGVVVADVSGKGVPGSMVMTMIRTALRTEAKARGSAAEVLSRVNDFIMGDIRKGMFVTLFYIVLDSRRRRITFASAGHNPIILYRASTQKTYYFNPKGFPVGISLAEKDLFKKSIEDDTIQLGKGDIILCYTDGITEAMNSQRQLFGEERLLKVVRENGHLRANQFVERLKEEILSFTEGQVQYDDISLVVIKENMDPEEVEFEMAKQVYYQVVNSHSMTESCQNVGLPVSIFSQKYKDNFENMGVERFREDFETTSVEAKHLSIEEQTRIYDIIRIHPEMGPKRISQLLGSEEYGFTEINPRRIYDELVRKRLNTKKLREAYVARGDNKKHMKPPGTPMLTLDGQIIIEDHSRPKLTAPVDPVVSPKESKDKDSAIPEKEVKRREPVVKVNLDDAEVSDLVLNDIVDLLDKGTSEDTEISEKTGVEDRDGNKIESSFRVVDEDEVQETHEFAAEVDPDIKLLLGDLDDLTDEEETEDEELDFSDLSTSEYTKELFADKTNGEDETKEDSDETNENVREESETIDHADVPQEVSVESTEDVLNALSVQIDDSSDGESEDDDHEPVDEFMELITAEKDLDHSEESVIEESVIEAEAPEEGTLEEEEDQGDESERMEQGISDEEVADVPEDGEQIMSEETTSELLDEQLMDQSGNESQKMVSDELFDTLSVRVDDDEPVKSHEELVEVDVDEDLFNLVTSEEIKIDEEMLAVPKPSRESIRIREKERVRFEEKQQKMLVAGGHYYMQKNYDKAISVFQKIITKYPSNIEAYYNLGNSYFRLNKWDKAESAYEQACELDPTFLDAMENLGVIYANQRKFKLAIDVWKRILELDPKRSDIKKNIEKALKLSKSN